MTISLRRAISIVLLGLTLFAWSATDYGGTGCDPSIVEYSK